MYNYQALVSRVLEEGEWKGNRTGIRTKSLTGATLRYDLREGFPLMTTKKVPFLSVVGELCGFIRGYTNAKDFRELGCRIWDANANKNAAWLRNPYREGEDDLGPIYGAQWRNYGDLGIDQLHIAYNTIVQDPNSRRMIVTAWNPEVIDQMALPPCHMMFQFLANEDHNYLDLVMTQRSADLFLGVPFNIASYALLLELFARATGKIARNLVLNFGDVHIYENHVPQCEEQIRRAPRALPAISIKTQARAGFDVVRNFSPADIQLIGYDPHPALPGAMAV